MEKLINPNWHVLLIHYPIALIFVGLAIEIISRFWKDFSFVSAGRWMIVIGAYFSIPAALAGVYAYRDILKPPAHPDFTWQQIISQTNMTAGQLEFFDHHIDYNLTAVCIIVAAVFLALMMTGRLWRSMYWLFLLAVIVSAGLFSIGAWYGGEAVYRLGAAVLPKTAEVSQQMHPQHGIDYYIQPLQLHIVMAGYVFALALAAISLSIRNWVNPPGSQQARQDPDKPIQPPMLFQSLHSGIFWVFSFILVLVVASAGLWSTMEIFSPAAIASNLKSIFTFETPRLSIHALSGVVFVMLTIVLAILTMLKLQRKGTILVLMLILVLSAAVQISLGSLMLFDSYSGPLAGLAK